MTIVAAHHLRVLLHGWRAWKAMDRVIICLWHIRRKPELLDILVVSGEEVRHRHAILSVEVAVRRQTHVFLRMHTERTEVASHGCRSGASFVTVGRIRHVLLPAR